MIAPGLRVLRALRALRVVGVECRTTSSGAVRASVLVDTGGKVRRFGPSTAVLRMVDADKWDISPAQGIEIDRVARAIESALTACSEWQAELQRRATAAAERAIRNRSNSVARSAVARDMSRGRLLRIVGEAWDLHAVKHVMES